MRGIVIGAGIGGLAVALGLQRQGLEVEVYEAAEAIRPVGAGLALAPNGLNALSRLDTDLGQEVAAAGLAFDRFSLQQSDGTVLSAVDTRSLATRFGHRPLTILRSELHACLCRRLEAGSLRLGKGFAGYETTPTGLRVRFDDGSQTEADFLLGADGLRSAVRQQLLGACRLRYAGQTCWRGLSPLVLPATYAGQATEIWGQAPGRRAGFSQATSELTYFYLTDAAPAGQPGLTPAALRERFAGFPPVVAQLLAALPAEQLIHGDLYDLAPLQRYTQGRVALLGDAAHATTPNLGQGANQALESALVLSQCLSRISRPGQLEAAFAEYERRRMPRASSIVARSWRLGALSQLRHGQGLRNLLMRLTPASLMSRSFAELYSLEA